MLLWKYAVEKHQTQPWKRELDKSQLSFTPNIIDVRFFSAGKWLQLIASNLFYPCGLCDAPQRELGS